MASVFAKMHACLHSNGIFINADQILGKTADIERTYEQVWLQQAQQNGCTEQEIATALTRMEEDKTLPLATQLSLLEQAGFTKVNP